MIDMIFIFVNTQLKHYSSVVAVAKKRFSLKMALLHFNTILVDDDI